MTAPAAAYAQQPGRTAEDYAYVLVILGIVATAYLLSYLLLNWLSRRYGFVTAVPYVVLGIIVATTTGWMPAETMELLEPLVAVAVGVVALATGLEVKGRRLAGQEATTVKLAAMVTILTLLVVVLLPMVALNQWPPSIESAQWLPALIALGGLALIADSRPIKALSEYLGLPEETTEQVEKVAWLSTTAGVVLFGLAISIYNPGPAWFGMPADAGVWLLAHLLVGGFLGAIGGALVQARPDEDRLLTILLGLAVTAGALGYVTSLSIVFINFIVGVVLINISSESLRIKKLVNSMHGPLYVLLLFFAGTLWTVGIPSWGYLAILAYLGLRFFGRFLGAALYRPRLSGYRPEPGIHRALLAPGALTAAMILDFSFGFEHLELVDVFVSAFVLLLIAEELISFFLVRGWLIDISKVGASRRSTSPWGDWKGDR